MVRNSIQASLLFSLLCMILVFAGTAFADTPIVNSFTADPQLISNNWGTTLSWNTSNSAGRDVYFSCPLGVAIKKDGANFPCNTRQSISGDPVGSAGFMFTNVSGATQNVIVTFYPKDSDGTNYDQGAVRRTLSVQTSPQPIIDFSISSTTIASGALLVLTWKGVDAGGVNVQFECADSIRIRTSLSAVETLPCGKPALLQDLPISGSYTVYPTNSLRTPVSVTVRVFPAIGESNYDATHSLTADFSVLGIPATVSPSAVEFRSSTQHLASNESFILSWITRNSAGANIKFTCQDGLSVFQASSTAKVMLPCNIPAFNTPLAATGSTTISVTSTNLYGTNLGIVLLPQDSNGIYFQTTSIALNLTVLPAGINPTPSFQSQSSSILSTLSTTAPSSSPTAKANAKKYTFTLPLKRGSKNADVGALQKILAQFPDVYPDGSVTGYFGPATERALGLFQGKFGVAKKGDPGYGALGPKTRAKLNSLQ